MTIQDVPDRPGLAGDSRAAMAMQGAPTGFHRVDHITLIDDSIPGIDDMESPTPWGHDLWAHLVNEHNLTLLESQLQEIVRLCAPLVRADEIGMCGDRWLETGSPFPACDLCNGTGGIASASRCPECQP